jgi:hypothetical protein
MLKRESYSPVDSLEPIYGETEINFVVTPQERQMFLGREFPAYIEKAIYLVSHYLCISDVDDYRNMEVEILSNYLCILDPYVYRNVKVEVFVRSVLPSFCQECLVTWGKKKDRAPVVSSYVKGYKNDNR